MPDVVIIGGGCMGASVAYHLAMRGVTDVMLLERETQLGTGSTGRNAGGVRHQFSSEANILLSIESIRVLERFKDEIGYDVDLHQDGYLFLLATPEHVAAFERNVQRQRRLGVQVDWLEPRDVERLAPGMALDGVLAATFCARDGVADPNGVTMGFARAAQRHGVEIVRDTEVVGIDVEHGAVTAVRTRRDTIATRTIVNAAGPYARGIGAMAGIDIPVHPFRRHIFIARPSASAVVPTSRILVIDFESTFYFHREGANVLFGMGDPDEASSFDVSVRWDLLNLVGPVAARRLPALNDAELVRAWAGLYEMTPDAMPIIGPASGINGFFMINGFSGHGFQHSPAAGRLLADMIVGRALTQDVSSFAWERFSMGATAAEGNVV